MNVRIFFNRGLGVATTPATIRCSASPSSGPTTTGEMEGLIPLGFHQNLTRALPDARIADFTRDFTDFVLVKGPEEIALSFWRPAWGWSSSPTPASA